MPESIQFNPGRHLQAEHPWPSLHSSQAFRRCLACQRDPSNPMRCDTGGILWSLKKSLKSIAMVSHNFKASSCDNVSSWFSQTHFLPDPLVVRLCSVCMFVSTLSVVLKRKEARDTPISFHKKHGQTRCARDTESEKQQRLCKTHASLNAEVEAVSTFSTFAC